MPDEIKTPSQLIREGAIVPKKIFFTKGSGVHKERLASFEMALRDAGIAHLNMILVSSIWPPGCKRITKEEGIKLLHPGEIAFVFMIAFKLMSRIALSPLR